MDTVSVSQLMNETRYHSNRFGIWHVKICFFVYIKREVQANLMGILKVRTIALYYISVDPHSSGLRRFRDIVLQTQDNISQEF